MYGECIFLNHDYTSITYVCAENEDICQKPQVNLTRVVDSLGNHAIYCTQSCAAWFIRHAIV